MVEIVIEKPGFDRSPSPLTVIGIFEDNEYEKYFRYLGSRAENTMKEIISGKGFTGKLGTSLLLPLPGNAEVKKILLMGLGKGEKFTRETSRMVAGKSALKSREINESNFSIFPFAETDEDDIEAIAEGIFLSLYNFDKYKSGSETENNKIQKVKLLVDTTNIEKLQKRIGKVKSITEAVNFVRDLGNLPPNDCSPAQLISHGLVMADQFGLAPTILERYQMESIGLNGIVSVGKGSNNPPKMLVLEHTGSSPDARPYLLVGKAVTFDTGGISLKPSEKMDEMKFDKCGGCTVLGLMRAISELKLPIRVIGIIPCVENMPSSSSYRPGDIIRMFNGKTVEVLNTDAEGRIILADAIAYGVKSYKPKVIIDLATLTGASIIALGANVAAMIGTDDKLKARLKKLSDETGEKVWELPLWDEFHDQIKSHFADIKNIGGRPAGAITAAAFLSNFTDEIPWVHIDIAGTAWTQDGTSEKSYNPKGATGFGLRTIVKFLIEESLEST
ncbi:MAG TPA: leucyl aminopeptidase [Nitrososphaeraceae archaeon]|nr:leucyl aminopeptidase [Nitrososphaeraceae archaeon]